jgi:agmatinase
MSPTFDPDGPATGDGVFGLANTRDDAAVVIIPVPFEATTSFGRGTAGGPAAILEATRQVDLHDLETGEPWREGLVMLPIPDEVVAWNAEACALAAPIIAAGGAGDDPTLHTNLARVNAIGEALNAHVEAETAAVLAAGKIPAILGGDHAVPFGAHKAAARRFPGLGLLHIDAHADLRVAYEGFEWSHASILYNTLTKVDGIGAVSQVGLRDIGAAERAWAEQDDRVRWFTDPEIAWELAEGLTWQHICHRIVAPLPDKVWITFDVDGLDPALCPNTGTPVPGGLSWRHAMVLLTVLAASGREIVGFDLVEVSDQPWDANVGARLLYKLAGFALSTRPGAR